ncbi:MAG: hypothetical protein KAG86_10960 [Gammaproteobacteria bacterium]|nr:hypothetical protein [Gammaproteobacteria bacterium]
MAYPAERKEALLKKLLPPVNKTVAELSREEGISANTFIISETKLNKQDYPICICASLAL